MTAPTSDVTLRHSDGEEALDMRDHIVPIYAATRAHLRDNPFYQPENFWSRLIGTHAKTRDFDLVTAWINTTCIGYAFGSPSAADSALENQLKAAFPGTEPAGPVYVFREFSVDPAHQRHGHGARIHDELLRGRPERFARLLVRADNEPAQAAYRRWGWVTIGTEQPFENSSPFDAMALEIRQRI
ncbi:GNAT superfamily N-acetyltransferase [Actinoplanes lutulentus]|uniref:Acetyltransferase (GNAT) family protein n=1 Tax=Actinoplanes lutulentus TaxID=1287878 RepID=A0A327ZAG3_9ACTN|nr:GNAT family N-acetyltransferase [Actinoplanes lutulentus]MBB2947214.1 GNAT superfamily N-acetyltransferase [Actinoplanes lutulentus]RAK36489.1 acetyltransferase (GNAT) family protein [Actinoplanes lutulentus]